MPCAIRWCAVTRNLGESWAADLDRAGFTVRLEDISEKDANAGVHSSGCVLRGRERVKIVILEETHLGHDWIRISGSDFVEGSWMMLIIPLKTSFWPWSPRSLDLSAAIEKALTAIGARMWWDLRSEIEECKQRQGKGDRREAPGETGME
jgi:hypothetical protein